MEEEQNADSLSSSCSGFALKTLGPARPRSPSPPPSLAYPPPAPASRSYFAHSGRATCSLDALVETLSNSSKHALSRKEARDRVSMLAGLVPEWCTIIAPPPAPASGGGGSGVGSRDVLGGIDSGMVARPVKTKEVVRLNTRIRFGEVRQMIVFMAGGGGGGGGASQ